MVAANKMRPREGKLVLTCYELITFNQNYTCKDVKNHI